MIELRIPHVPAELFELSRSTDTSNNNNYGGSGGPNEPPRPKVDFEKFANPFRAVNRSKQMSDATAARQSIKYLPPPDECLHITLWVAVIVFALQYVRRSFELQDEQRKYDELARQLRLETNEILESKGLPVLSESRTVGLASYGYPREELMVAFTQALDSMGLSEFQREELKTFLLTELLRVPRHDDDGDDADAEKRSCTS